MTNAPSIKTNGQPTYHRDGTVSYWDVYCQQWMRRDAGSLAADIEAMPTLTPTDRARVSRMAAA